MNKVDFSRGIGLVPVVIQDNTTLQVLMVGYMNEEALDKTIQEGKVTFYSRSRKQLWTKGETSGNFLYVVEIKTDCDNDSILIKVRPTGPVCHNGTVSCFEDVIAKGFLYRLEEVINQRIGDNIQDSYTNILYRKGINKITQKVGEEAVELIIEAKDDDILKFNNEAADLLYHLLILFKAKEIKLTDIEEVLLSRHK
jgi:phosphoribosyl-AMP cyclohydrolase / phosphoribosyl-ATP pyrophosphohydrolase